MIQSIIALRNKTNLIKLMSISAATVTAITIRLFYSENLADSKNKNKEKLISVHMFSRHGARTPLSLIPGIEEASYEHDLLVPFVKAKYELRTLDNGKFEDIMSYYDQLNFEKKLRGGIGRGQLTRVGEEQMFNLGKRIKEKYINNMKFLSSEYNPNEFYSRSSHYRRTINSAKSFLSGVYCMSNLDVPEKPFIINVLDLKEDYLFPNAVGCQYFAEMHQFLDRLELYTHNLDYIQNLNKLNLTLSKNKKTNISYTQFRDDISARHIHNLPISEEFMHFYKLADRYAALELSASAKHNLKISCGQLLNMIRENLLDTIEKDSNNKNIDNHKFRYYSAHDSTLNAILCSFNYINDENDQWPPFAADLIIELWKDLSNNESSDEKNYFIRIYYCDKLISLPDCKAVNSDPSKHYLSDFIEVLNVHGTDKHNYVKMCGERFMDS